MSLYKKFDFSESELKELEIMKEEIENVRKIIVKRDN